MAADALVTPMAVSLPLPHSGACGNACVFQWVKFWTVPAVWRYPSAPVCTWVDISRQDRPSLRTATLGETAVTRINAQNPCPPGLNRNSPSVYVAMVPGNAPMKAALVRERGTA